MRACAGRCGQLTDKRYCPSCRPPRASRQARGYDAAYDAARKRWAVKVRLSGVHCHAPVCVEPARLIVAGQPWDLGHDEDRNIRGPEHSTCNRSAGGKAAHAYDDSRGSTRSP